MSTQKFKVSYLAFVDKDIMSFNNELKSCEEMFDNIDHGYDRYQWLRKQWWASKVTWEHIEKE